MVKGDKGARCSEVGRGGEVGTADLAAEVCVAWGDLLPKCPNLKQH